MRKSVLSLLISISLVLTLVGPLPVSAYHSGTCGKNVEWVLDDNGTLTISGTGEMADYHFVTGSHDGFRQAHKCIPPWYDYRDSIKTIKILSGVTTIGDCAFWQCENAVSINIPTSVERIGTNSFQDCKSLKSISFPQSINILGASAFQGCSSLTKVSIPNGVTHLPTFLFAGCRNLKTIYLPSTVTHIRWQGIFSPLYIFYGGSEAAWTNASKSFDLPLTSDTNVYYNASPSDISNLVMVRLNGNLLTFEQPAVVKNGRTLVPLRAIFEAMGATVDWHEETQTVTSVLGSTKIELQIGSNILYKNGTAVKLDVPAQIMRGRTMVPVKAVAESFGADVGWDEDSQTVHITTTGNVYTVHSVPQITYDGYDANFANFNGMYIDSFSHKRNDDGTETVTFDVYNTQYIYGLVEIYYADGTLKDVAIIDRMSNSTSIKGVLIDDTGKLIRDIWNGTALTYKQESGYSKKTPIDIDIPQGGCIKITNDMSESFIASVINLSHIVLSASDVFTALDGFDSEASKDFAYELSWELINSTAFTEAIKNPEQFNQELWKGVSDQLYMNSESVGGFLDTISRNLDKFSDGALAKLVFSSAANYGVDIAEETFKSLAGPAKVALDAIFMMASATDFLLELDDSVNCMHQGSIIIKTTP